MTTPIDAAIDEVDAMINELEDAMDELKNRVTDGIATGTWTREQENECVARVRKLSQRFQWKQRRRHNSYHARSSVQ